MNKKNINKTVFALFCASSMTFLNAQTRNDGSIENSYNKWSIELHGGVNKPQRPMSIGYSTSTPSPYVADLGVRYMINNKFGLKADFGYNSFEGGSSSIDFETKYYRADIQGVANLGRIMSFETWTNTIGLLGHAGFGLAQMESDNSALKDRMGNFMAGLTGQIRLSNRIALTGDFTTILNARQDATFEGSNIIDSRGFTGILFNGTVGVAVYLGKNTKHADWVNESSNSDNAELKQKIADIEMKMLDDDKDGVANYLDLQPNTISGVMVDTKGRSIDLNNNSIPDELENYLLKTYKGNVDKSKITDNNESIKDLINGGYVCTYFDYNESTPTNVSTEGIDFVLTYLRNNPSSTVNIIGHTDESGTAVYNDKLSNARAKNVKNILLKGGIDASRLNIIAAGEDYSVDKDSDGAKKMVRRVTFKVK